MLTSLALILLCGLLMGSLFKKLRLPSLIGMIIAGIILGPYVCNFLDDTILLIGPDLRELALMIILVRAGLSLDINDLKSIGRPAILMSFLPACFEMTATIIFAPSLLNITHMEAALLGAVIASASPAVIVPRMLRLMDEGYGIRHKIPQMILAGDSVDDVFNIVVFTMLLNFHTSGDINASFLVSIPSSLILGVLLGILGGIVLSFICKKINMNDSNKVVLMIGFALLFVGIEHILKDVVAVSGLLAVMISGIVMLKTRPEEAKKISEKFSKLWTGAEIILFVMIGASVDISFSSNYLWQTIVLLLVILTIRSVGILICLIGSKLNWKERFFVTLTGIPKATVQAAIGGIPLAMGLSVGPMILAVAVITILVTAPIGAVMIDYLHPVLLTKEK